MGVIFKIERIETERCINGKSTISASAIHNGDKVFVQIRVPNEELTNRQLIKSLLMDCFSELTRSIEIKPISIGDFL